MFYSNIQAEIANAMYHYKAVFVGVWSFTDFIAFFALLRQPWSVLPEATIIDHIHIQFFNLCFFSSLF